MEVPKMATVANSTGSLFLALYMRPSMMPCWACRPRVKASSTNDRYIILFFIANRCYNDSNVEVQKMFNKG